MHQGSSWQKQMWCISRGFYWAKGANDGAQNACQWLDGSRTADLDLEGILCQAEAMSTRPEGAGAAPQQLQDRLAAVCKAMTIHARFSAVLGFNVPTFAELFSLVKDILPAEKALRLQAIARDANNAKHCNLQHLGCQVLWKACTREQLWDRGQWRRRWRR